MKALVIIAAFMLAAPIAWGQCAGCASEQLQYTQHSPTNHADGPRYHWYHHATDPNVLILYRGSNSTGWELAGILDPEAGSWRWTPDSKLHDLIAGLGKREAGEKRGESGRAGRGASLVGSLPPNAKPPDCKCGDDCECRDGRKGLDCTCAECKCAIVASPEMIERRKMIQEKVNQRLKDAGIQAIPAKPKAGVIEEQRPTERGDTVVQAKPGDVIDGETRGKKDFRLGGVDTSQLRKGGSMYTITDKQGSREVGASEALSAIEGDGKIPDDAKLVRITVIGGDAVRGQVVKDLDSSPALAWIKGRSVVNSYSPAHWRVKDGGFVTPPNQDGVVIYAQLPDGKVLWRQDNYAGGAESLARALRDRVPGYDPNKDPSPRKPGPLSPDASPSSQAFSPWWLSMPVAVFLAWYMSNKKKAVAPA